VEIDEGQQKIEIVHTNWQSNLRGSGQSIFSLCWHHPTLDWHFFIFCFSTPPQSMKGKREEEEAEENNYTLTRGGSTYFNLSRHKVKLLA